MANPKAIRNGNNTAIKCPGGFSASISDGIVYCPSFRTNEMDNPVVPDFTTGLPSKRTQPLTRSQKHELQGGLVDIMGPNKRNIPGTDIMQQFA